MNKRTLLRLISVFAALVMGLSVLTGCGTKSAEQLEKQEDAQTIRVYLWTNGLYEIYAPYVQAQLPDVNIEFIVGNNDLDFYKFLQQNGGLPDIITCCRFSLHDAAPLKDSLMNLATTNEAGAVYNNYLNSFKNEDGSVNWLPVCADAHFLKGFAGSDKAGVIGGQRDAVLHKKVAVDHKTVGIGAYGQPVYTAVLIFEVVEVGIVDGTRLVGGCKVHQAVL